MNEKLGAGFKRTLLNLKKKSLKSWTQLINLQKSLKAQNVAGILWLYQNWIFIAPLKVEIKMIILPFFKLKKENESNFN